MKFRKPICMLIGLELSLASVAAHGSYVVEAEGSGISTGAITSAADFDFVAHDFGMESSEAIQITLDQLGSSANVRGNLLLWSFEVVAEPVSEAIDHEETSSSEHIAASGLSTPGHNEDYSFYEDATDGDNNTGLAGNSESLPSGIQDLPPIDTNAIFWILGPAEFTSFSQLTAARFGFDRGQ